MDNRNNKEQLPTYGSISISNPSSIACCVSFSIFLNDARLYTFGLPLPLSAMSIGMKPAILKSMLHMGLASKPFQYIVLIGRRFVPRSCSSVARKTNVSSICKREATSVSSCTSDEQETTKKAPYLPVHGLKLILLVMGCL